MIEDYIRRAVERAIRDAEHPSGMSTHDGKARVEASYLRRMLVMLDAAPSPPAQGTKQLCELPKINAVFETVLDGVVGRTSAPVKRLEAEDDGSYSVVIDYWPTPPAQQDADALTVLRELVEARDAFTAASGALQLQETSLRLRRATVEARALLNTRGAA